MRRFKWRLQRVLDIRQKEEQVKRAQLLEITERLSQTSGVLFMQKRIIKNLIDDLSQEPPQSRLNRQALFMTWSEINNAKIRKLEAEVETLKTQQREKMDEILAIKRLNEGLEKLRSQAEVQFRYEQEKLEQKEMDEAATSRFSRKMVRQNTAEDFSGMSAPGR